jgi:curved DNA-binding protein CbpA
MSAHELGPDPARWPENPYELLGVSFGMSPRDLRRAYTRLIRTYKPEQFPEHFRRIREAYETVLRHAEFFTFGAAASPANGEPMSEETAAPSPEPESGAADGKRDGMVPARARGLEEQLNDLWEQACRGEEREAYWGLRELSQRYPRHSDLRLRLYWLLALSPELDEGRSPCAWLVEELRDNGLPGSARELYRRELEADPVEALTDRCAALLECQAPAERLTELAGWRWQAAGRLGRWDVITDDLQRLRQLVLGEGEEAWVRLLLASLDQLAWAPGLPDGQIGSYFQEVEQLGHLGARLGFEFDRLEFLRELSAQWRRLAKDRLLLLPALAPALVPLVPLSWTRPIEEVRPALLEFLGWVARHAHDTLNNLDRLQNLAPAVLAQFGRLLESLRDDLDVPPEPEVTEAVTRLTLDFLEGGGNFSYGEEDRHRLLDFCLREAVSPELVARVVENEVRLAELLTNDWPLRYVYLAYQLFWA